MSLGKGHARQTTARAKALRQEPHGTEGWAMRLAWLQAHSRYAGRAYTSPLPSALLQSPGQNCGASAAAAPCLGRPIASLHLPFLQLRGHFARPKSRAPPVCLPSHQIAQARCHEAVGGLACWSRCARGLGHRPEGHAWVSEGSFSPRLPYLIHFCILTCSALHLHLKMTREISPRGPETGFGGRRDQQGAERHRAGPGQGSAREDGHRGARGMAGAQGSKAQKPLGGVRAGAQTARCSPNSDRPSGSHAPRPKPRPLRAGLAP